MHAGVRVVAPDSAGRERLLRIVRARCLPVSGWYGRGAGALPAAVGGVEGAHTAEATTMIY